MSDPSAPPERPADLTASPYVGLVPYGEQDAAFFFGRNVETRILSGNLRASDLTLLYGASGVGKTSLLHAGVIHDLHERARRTELVLTERVPFAVCSFTSWRDEPLPALMEAIRVATAEAVGDREVPAWQPGQPVTDALRSWTERVRTLLVILDQFEDYFLYHPEEAGPEPFAEELPQIVNDPNLRVHVLLSIREDALAKLDRFKGSIPRLFANYLRVEHLSRDAARDAIEGPLREWNRRQPDPERPYLLGPGLADAVIDATATGGVTLVRNGRPAEAEATDRERVEAPFLQLVMERLWRDAAGEGSHDLTVERLDRLGGPQQIVESHLLDALGALSPGQQEIAAELFRFLVTSSKTKIAHPASDLGEWTGRDEAAVEPVLDQLCRGESGRILRRVPPPLTGNGATSYELYHDVLAEPILEWRREYEQERRRRVLRRRVLRIGAGVLTLVAVISWLGILAFVQRNEARSATRSASSLALATAAIEQLPGEVDEALLLALEGYREAPSPGAATAMVESLSAARRSGAIAILRDHPRGARAIAWSPDRRTLASADFDGTVRLWDLQGRRPLGEPLTDHTDDVWSLAFAPDGTTLASASHDGTVRLWDVSEQTLDATLTPADEGLITSVAWSPDGETLAFAGESGRIQIWNPETRKALGPPLEGHSDRVVSLAFDPEDKTLASGSYDGTIRFWDVRQRTSIGRIVNAHGGRVLSIAWSPDGRKLVSSGSDGLMRIWDPDSGRPLVQAFGANTGDIWGVAWSADGRTIASSGDDGTVRTWDARDGTPLGEPLRGHLDRVNGVVFAPVGDTLASSSYDGTVRIWTLPTRVLGDPIGRHEGQVKAVAYGPDGRLLASADFGGIIRLWDLRSRKLHSQLADDRTTSVSSVAWSPDSRMFASAGDSIALWDAVSGELTAALDGHNGNVQSIAWSRDGRTLASGGADGTVRLWGFAGRGPRGDPLLGHEGEVLSVALSPDGSTVASVGTDGTLRLWDVQTQEPTNMVTLEDSDLATSVAFSPDGNLLATGSTGGHVQLWGVEPLLPLGEDLDGHDLEVRSVTFSPDGLRLLSAGEDGSVRIWDVEQRRALGDALRSGAAAVYTVQFAPDGLSFASGASDGVVRLWEGILWHDLADLETQVCRLVVGDLSRDEWDRLVPGLPYRESCA